MYIAKNTLTWQQQVWAENMIDRNTLWKSYKIAFKSNSLHLRKCESSYL